MHAYIDSHIAVKDAWSLANPIHLAPTYHEAGVHAHKIVKKLLNIRNSEPTARVNRVSTYIVSLYAYMLYVYVGMNE